MAAPLISETLFASIPWPVAVISSFCISNSTCIVFLPQLPRPKTMQIRWTAQQASLIIYKTRLNPGLTTDKGVVVLINVKVKKEEVRNCIWIKNIQRQHQTSFCSGVHFLSEGASTLCLSLAVFFHPSNIALLIHSWFLVWRMVYKAIKGGW